MPLHVRLTTILSAHLSTDKLPFHIPIYPPAHRHLGVHDALAGGPAVEEAHQRLRPASPLQRREAASPQRRRFSSARPRRSPPKVASWRCGPLQLRIYSNSSVSVAPKPLEYLQPVFGVSRRGECCRSPAGAATRLSAGGFATHRPAPVLAGDGRSPLQRRSMCGTAACASRCPSLTIVNLSQTARSPVRTSAWAAAATVWPPAPAPARAPAMIRVCACAASASRGLRVAPPKRASWRHGTLPLTEPRIRVRPR